MPPPRTRLLPTLLALVCFSQTSALAQTPAATEAPQTLPAKQAPQTLPTEVRWSVALPARPTAPPAIGGDRILLALQSGVVVAYGQADGVEAWRVEMRADQPVETEGDRVFVASGEAIHALALANAEVLWRAPAGTLTAPLLAQDGWIVAASATGLAAFRSSDGEKVWQRETGLQHGRATIEGDNLYVPLEDGRLLALDLRTGTDRWTRRFAIPKPAESGPRAPGVSEVLAFPDRVFVGAADGIFYCLKTSDGAVDWRFKIGAILRGRPVSDGTRIYTSAMDNVVRAFDRKGTLLWHPSVPFRPTTSPVLLGTTLLVPGAASEIRGFDVAGRPAGQIKLEDALAIAPVFAQTPGGAVVAAVTGSLNGPSKLLLLEESRALPVAPLTQLPGTIVPVVPPAPIG